MSKFETRFEADDDRDRICAVSYSADDRGADERPVNRAPQVSMGPSLQSRQQRARDRRAVIMDSLSAIAANVVGERQGLGFE